MNNVFSTSVTKIRWFTENCHEIILPSGKTLLIDPMLVPEEDAAKNDGLKGFYSGYTVDDIKACDYVFISHTHGDHIGYLKQIYDKFHPLILVNANEMMLLAKKLDITPRLMFPLAVPATYEFSDFKIETVVGQHVPLMGRDIDYAEMEKMFGPEDTFAPLGGAGDKDLNMCGIGFNTNFMLTTTNGTEIAFIAGDYSDYMHCVWRGRHPNVVIKQLSIPSRPGVLEGMAETVEDLNTPLLWTMDHQGTRKDPDGSAAKVNDMLKAKGVAGRMFVPKSGKWYCLFTGIGEE